MDRPQSRFGQGTERVKAKLRQRRGGFEVQCRKLFVKRRRIPIEVSDDRSEFYLTTAPNVANIIKLSDPAPRLVP